MDPDTETWKDAIEALDPERRARDVVDVYRRDIYRNERHACTGISRRRLRSSTATGTR